ncbi:hypothetical protein SSX86_008797 [Deinandra increscens subsp. villosa]|uniref:Uncharacterized protein n=1 Tax=Deinandra increscens subsp. villosa TaxID=3103831 RepID=A0AAP0DG26_9ASTR
MLAQKNSPKTTLKQPTQKPTTLQFLFDLDSKHSPNQNNGNKKIHSSDSRDEELYSIIVYCTESRSDDQEYSALKRLKLTQLLSIIKTSVTPISDQTLDVLFKMVAANLFRPLPPPSSNVCSMVSCEEAEDVIAVPSAAWAYLQIVYDILLRLIMKITVKSVQGMQ